MYIDVNKLEMQSYFTLDSHRIKEKEQRLVGSESG